MTRRITSLSDPAWQALFTGLQRSWFRLETLQQYDVEYEAREYQEFQQTGRLDPAPGKWQHMISAHKQAGRSLQRVHVLVEPLTAYLRYELAVYTRNARAGEQIGVIPTSPGAWPPGIPKAEDFWLFDDADAWAMIYDAAGRFIAAEQLTSVDDVSRCQQWRESAIAQSMPLADYIRRAA
jgi:hypothetical protein